MNQTKSPGQKWKTTCLACLLAAMLALFPEGVFAQKQATGPEVWKGRAMAMLLPEAARAFDAPPPALAAVLARYGVAAEPALPGFSPPQLRANSALPDLRLAYALSFAEEIPLETLLADLNATGLFEYTEPWYLYELFYQPNDPLADTTQGVDYQWHLEAIMARQAWNLQRNDTSVVVGVIDTGISFLHPDLQQNLQLNHLDPPDGIDNDLDGFVDNYRGWDFGGAILGGPGDNDPSEAGHGVGVTGTFAAVADNGIGTAGVCFNCRFIPVKAIADNRPESVAFGFQGVLYTAAMGASIINCSWGSTAYSRFGHDVVRFVTEAYGAAILAAAGNSQKDETYYPAGYPEVISVANSTYNDVICCNSTYNHTVDVSAPGFGIVGPVGNDGYFGVSGTSFASPVAAGAVALVKGYFPHYTGFQAAQRLRVTTDNHYAANPNYTDKLGTGRMNAFRALTDPLRPSVRLKGYDLYDLDGDGRLLSGDTLVLAAHCFNYLDAGVQVTAAAHAPGFAGFFLQPIDTLYTWGAISANSKLPAALFRFRVHPATSADFQFQLRLSYRDTATGYEDFEYLYFVVNPSYLNLRENRLQTTVTSRGNLGFNDFGLNQQGLGVRYAGAPNSLYEAGFLLGTGPGQVSDQIRNATGQDKDFFATTPVGFEPGPADAMAVARFDDRTAPLPIGAAVTHRAYSWRSPADQAFVIHEYELFNPGNATVFNAYAGLFADWDLLVGGQNRNVADYDEAAKLGYVKDFTQAWPYVFGVSLLTDEPFHTFATLASGGFDFSNSAKFSALSSPVSPLLSKAGYDQNGADVVQFVSGGPFSLAPGQSRRIAFALMAGKSATDLAQVRATALTRYRCDVLGERPLTPFALPDMALRAGQPADFSDQNEQATSWVWDFGDGTTLTGKNIAHTYQSPGVYRVALTVSTPNCQATLNEWVKVEAPLGLPEVKKPVWAYSPNPFSQTLHITSEAPFRKVVVSDLAGRTIKIWENRPTQEAALSLGSVPPGLYVLTVFADQFTQSALIAKRSGQ